MGKRKRTLNGKSSSNVPASDVAAAKGLSLTTLDSQHVMTRVSDTVVKLGQLVTAGSTRQQRSTVATELREADFASGIEVRTGHVAHLALNERPLDSLCPFGDRDELWRRSAADRIEQQKQVRLVRAAIEAQARADSADIKTDTNNFSALVLPENTEVIQLAQTINRRPERGRSRRDIAIQFTGGNEKKR